MDVRDPSKVVGGKVKCRPLTLDLVWGLLVPAILTRAFERTINKRLVLAIEWLSNEDSCPDQSQVQALGALSEAPTLWGQNSSRTSHLNTNKPHNPSFSIQFHFQFLNRESYSPLCDGFLSLRPEPSLWSCLNMFVNCFQIFSWCNMNIYGVSTAGGVCAATCVVYGEWASEPR